MIDLAGSERLSEGEKTPERIEEAKYINKSLSALGNVISALKHLHLLKGRQLHIPYRDSKLTHILKDSLGGNSLTHIIITLSPTLQSLPETLSSMKFAHNAKSVKQHLKENVRTFIGIRIKIALLELKAKSKRRRNAARPHNNMHDFESSGSEEEEVDFLTDRMSFAGGVHQPHHSVSSEDLVELSKYFQQKQSLKNLKSEVAESRKKVKEMQQSSNIRKLFMKTLDKLLKYKSENVSMHEKILNLQVSS